MAVTGPEAMSGGASESQVGALALDESVLLEGLRAGEEGSFRALIEAYGGRLLALTRRFLEEEEARDALQETFLSAFKALPKFDGRSRLYTWLYRIAVNACLMRRRTKSRRGEESMEDLTPVFDATGHRVGQDTAWMEPEVAAQRSEMREVVRDAIASLPDTHREVLMLRDIEGMDTAETAAVLGISTGAVKVRLHRARIALRTLLDPYLSEGDAA